MGNCLNKKTLFNPGAVLDRVIASASTEDDCPLYELANFKKGGKLVEAFTKGGSKQVRGSKNSCGWPVQLNLYTG